ncbi:MAG: ribonuclease R [Gammaproteobacteria bacterium]|nr:ribonuclease R [Gammaproteobacteria bacterium]
MDKPHHKADEFADREARKYVRPIASREYIMEILAEKGEPLTWQELAGILDFREEQDIDALQRRLRAMERDGQVIRNRREGYGLVEKMDLVRGYVSAHPDGYGFLVPDDSSDDLFLSARQMRAVIHGDRVVARVSGIDRRGRREGAIVEILQRNTHSVVGRFFRESGIGFIIPDNKRITHDIAVPAEYQGQAQEGQIVVVELIEQPTKRRQPLGRVIEVLGEHMAPGMEIDVAIRAHELPHRWPAEVDEEIQSYSEEVSRADTEGREDIRRLPLVTIDGPDARDFDDAVYCERNGKDWRLIVAIADVSHYVGPASALDQSAQERGNSVYFPGRVIPMLPELLSNGLCSINPGVERLCMVCDMNVSASGAIKSYRFYSAVMKSHARMIYDDVAAMLEGDEVLCQRFAELLPHLENLHQLYHVFAKQRIKRGTIEFETTETVIKFGPQKKIQSIVPLSRNVAHKLIEECMITANICAARYLDKHTMPTLYRVHELPDADKLADLREFLKSFGLKLEGGARPEAAHYAHVLSQVGDRPESHLIQTVLLRSMKQAVYSPDNIGHFGLALTQYAHFTSPIRRYPDLLVHRAIAHLLKGGTADDFDYSVEDMARLGEQCSMTERRADEATRDVEAWLKCEYMMDKVGECFDGIISGVTSFGLFVELQGIYVEGLIHVTSLSNDYYHFDPVKHCLVGERTRQVYSLADKVNVRVVRVDLDEKRIDFDLANKYDEQGGKKHRGAKQRGKSKHEARKPGKTAPEKPHAQEKSRPSRKTKAGAGQRKSKKTAPKTSKRQLRRKKRIR